MSWGWKITIGYSVFVLFMLFMVYQTTSVEFELVTKDYYGKELAFQGQIDKQRNAIEHGHDIAVAVEPNGLALKFSNYQKGAKVSGIVSFFRPSDGKLDRTFQWEIDEEGVMYVPGDEFSRGQYVFMLDGVMDADSFYIEKPVFIP